MISGFGGPRVLELRLGRHAAVATASGARCCGSRAGPCGRGGACGRGARPACGSAGRAPCAATAISSREACMKSTSSGSGLRSVLAIASTPRSATSRRRISASISFLSCSMRSRTRRCSRRSSSGGQLAADLLAGRPPSASRACRRGRGSAACGRGSRCRRPGGRAPCRRSAARPGGPAPASCAWSPFISAWMSIWAISSGVSASIARRRRRWPSPWRCCSCISRHISSSVVVVAVDERVLRAAQARSRPRTPSRTPASGRCSSPAWRRART